jgi:hypothetical protein
MMEATTMRSMILFSLLAGLAFTVPFGGAADAQTYTRKKCTASSRLATPVTWVCKASEKCCYDYVVRKGTCLGASTRCF